MTIIVYDSTLDICYADTLHTISGSFKEIPDYRTKVTTLKSGLKYTVTGVTADGSYDDVIDSLVAPDYGAVRVVPEMDPASSNIMIRDAGGKVWLGGDCFGKMVLYPGSTWTRTIPWSRGSGGYAFDLYYMEHGDTDLALELTLRYAHGCGGTVEKF